MTRVCIVRWHDGAAKANWGGRATSLGLARIIDASDDFELSSVVNGVVIVRGFEERGNAQRAAHYIDRVRGRFSGRRRPLYDDGDFDRVETHAARLLSTTKRSPAFSELVSALSDCDEVWVNGEGDLILRRRVSLYRMLLIVHLAVQLGKPVRIVNSILSDPTGEARTPAVEDAVRRGLAVSHEVVYRDKQSLRMHSEIMAPIPARHLPDALFTWAGSFVTDAPGGPGWEMLPPSAHRLLASGRRYAAISGRSGTMPGIPETVRADFRRLGEGMKAAGLEPLAVATDDADGWLVKEAQRLGWAWVPARVPLATAWQVLGRASVFVSGRYHPSILASAAGTPVALMGSNSHKTASLQELLGYAYTVPDFGSGGDLVPASLAAASHDRGEVLATATELGRAALSLPTRQAV